MKGYLVLASAAALAACSQAAEEEAAPVETVEAEPAPEPVAATDPAGTYDVSDADGNMGTTVINADGTYTDTDDEGNTTTGTFVRRAEGDCFDPEGEEAEVCWTVGTPAADGSFVATAPDGTTVTVRRRESAEPAA